MIVEESKYILQLTVKDFYRLSPTACQQSWLSLASASDMVFARPCKWVGDYTL